MLGGQPLLAVLCSESCFSEEEFVEALGLSEANGGSAPLQITFNMLGPSGNNRAARNPASSSNTGPPKGKRS